MVQSKKKERRYFKRIKKTLYVQCRPFATTAPWCTAIIQDISEAGMSISTIKEFPIGKVLEIKVSTFLRRQQLNVLGRVVSCEGKGSKGAVWVIHISFTYIDEENKSILQELIQIFLKTTEKEKSLRLFQGQNYF